VLHEVVAAIVAGDNAGAGALDVECVREIAVRDLSRNSTMICFRRKIKSQEQEKRTD
jgi:hypothetical protein